MNHSNPLSESPEQDPAQADSVAPRLYFDYNSTTPFAPGVLEAMLPFLSKEFGNPSSNGNPYGRRAKQALQTAREQVSQFLDARPEEVIFTSGGTESIFSALVGVFRAQPQKKHLITSVVEHPAVLQAAEFLREMCGVEVSKISVSSQGELDLNELRSAIREDTAVLSFMYANNETGICFPIKEISEIAKAQGVLLHTDAVQATGKELISFSSLGVDLLSLSGHKFGASKGVGALLLKADTPWKPLTPGGGQESGRRGGTECVSLLVGLGAASEYRLKQLQAGASEEVEKLRDLFEKRFLEIFPTGKINGKTQRRLRNTSNIVLPGVPSAELLPRLALRGISLSAGAACKASSVEPSYVLRALGLSLEDCLSTLRVSFGFSSSEEEMEVLLQSLREETKK